MKKFLMIFLMLVSLCACSSEDLKTSLDRVSEQEYVNTFKYPINHKSNYFVYYIPRDVTVVESENSYTLFEYKQNKIVMTLNIANIIGKQFYENQNIVGEDFVDDKDLYYSKEGTLNSDTYYLNIYKVDDYYTISLYDAYSTLNAIVKSNYVVSTTETMLKICANVKVDLETVANDFSNKEIVDFTKEQVDLFKVIVPKDGRLEDIINKELDIANINKNTNQDIVEDIGG